MITIQRIEQLMKAQDDLNKVYAGEDWATKGYDFLGYAAVETAELLNHHGGMFHYRKQEPDWPQIEMELVDILHFLLSAAIQTDLTAEALWEPVGMSRLVVGEHTVHSRGKLLIHEATSNEPEPWTCWVRFLLLVDQCDFALDHIFNKYQLKYTLNRFRITNGSVTGGYKKVWSDGREDNEHLQELAPSVFDKTTGEYDLDTLTDLLQQRYSTKASDPLASLQAEGFVKQQSGTWVKFCRTADEREAAISKVVCIKDAVAGSSYRKTDTDKGWEITAQLSESQPTNG